MTFGQKVIKLNTARDFMVFNLRLESKYVLHNQTLPKTGCGSNFVVSTSLQVSPAISSVSEP